MDCVVRGGQLLHSGHDGSQASERPNMGPKSKDCGNQHSVDQVCATEGSWNRQSQVSHHTSPATIWCGPATSGQGGWGLD